MEASPPPTPTEPNLPITDNFQFLNELGKLLDNIVHHWDQVLFAHAFRPQLKSAWNELRPEFMRLRDQLGPNISADVRTGLPEPGLGEGQAQRKLKLDALSAVWRRFFRRPTSRRLRELLEWIDQILDSLAQVLPGLKAVQEFKEAIERLIVSDRA